ncbi:MAG: filamentous hemagglutinin N-terminal domain-containing protein [Rhodocyclaceae bacterium]|nr:filamentous hemagglutinin N-terminal domain-containing protein [Rhodocyclaceae bacterium]
MNSIYRSIWNDKTGTFVAVSENATSAGKKSSPGATTVVGAVAGNTRFALKALAVSLMMTFGANVFALPVDGVVTAGGASFSSTASSTTITQTTSNVAINWQSFSIGAGEAVQFIQPSSSSVALNRVLGADPSNIFGSLSANGKVFLVNPNGILFAPGASVNVSGLVASTLNISDSDFMASNYKFSGTGGTVLNQGTINADGGYVALLGASVSNQGTIVARLGTVALAAGNAITLDVAGDGLLNVTVNQGAVNALIENGGLIQADGGHVLLTAQAAGYLLQTVVNNTGVIQARTIENRNGTIMLMGDMQSGTMNVGGTLDASAPNGGNGGFIETSAAFVKIANDVKVTTAAPFGQTGTWLIDPLDFYISASGGNISGSTLADQLVTNNVIISNLAGLGNGDIFVNDAVSWSASGAPTTLTLNAFRDVNINAAITATNGSLSVCCGRDVNVNAAITTTNGSVLLAANRDINVFATPGAITTTDGNMTLCAGNNVNVIGAITLTNGTSDPTRSLGLALGLTLSAGNNGTGPGVAGGTVVFGSTPATVTGPNAPVTIYYNPVSYAAPTNYLPNFVLVDSVLTQFMLVFPDGANKTFDGTTVATFTGLKGLPPGVTLGGAGTANFDTAAVGTDKTVSFTGFSLAGASAANYAFANSCCGPAVRRTTANIISALPVIPPVPPIGREDFAAEEIMGPEGFAPLTFAITPRLMPRIDLAGLPPQLLSIVPVVVPPPPPLVEEERPPIYVPPVRPPKQDRN